MRDLRAADRGVMFPLSEVGVGVDVGSSRAGDLARTNASFLAVAGEFCVDPARRGVKGDFVRKFELRAGVNGFPLICLSGGILIAGDGRVLGALGCSSISIQVTRSGNGHGDVALTVQCRELWLKRKDHGWCERLLRIVDCFVDVNTVNTIHLNPACSRSTCWGLRSAAAAANGDLY
jgi:hypothetical protein